MAKGAREKRVGCAERALRGGEVWRSLDWAGAVVRSRFGAALVSCFGGVCIVEAGEAVHVFVLVCFGLGVIGVHSEIAFGILVCRCSSVWLLVVRG